MKFYQLVAFIFIATLASCSTSSIEEENELYVMTESKAIMISENETELLAVINEYRNSIGLNTLIMDATIYNVAREHNLFMIEDDGISHTNFSLRADQVKSNTRARNVSENVARFFQSNTGVLNGWLNSPSHKATLEGNFTHTVISITEDSNGAKYYTQLFYSK